MCVCLCDKHISAGTRLCLQWPLVIRIRASLVMTGSRRVPVYKAQPYQSAGKSSVYFHIVWLNLNIADEYTTTMQFEGYVYSFPVRAEFPFSASEWWNRMMAVLWRIQNYYFFLLTKVQLFSTSLMGRILFIRWMWTRYCTVHRLKHGIDYTT